MFEIDHIPVWTRDRDGAIERLAVATGLPVLEGFAPEGRRGARGVRFSNGPFLDVHQADAEGGVLLGLSGDVGAGEALAARQGWRTRTAPRREEPDAEPWSILSFRRGQGVLATIFVIDYAKDPEAWTSTVFSGGLYHLSAGQGPALRRIWLTAADSAQAGAVLEAFGFVAGGEARSSVAPGSGRIYRGRRADVVLAEGQDAVVRFDVDGEGPVRVVEVTPQLTAVVGRDPGATQQG
jgi:hypothetical protein